MKQTRYRVGERRSKSGFIALTVAITTFGGAFVLSTLFWEDATSLPMPMPTVVIASQAEDSR